MMGQRFKDPTKLKQSTESFKESAAPHPFLQDPNFVMSSYPKAGRKPWGVELGGDNLVSGKYSYEIRFHIFTPIFFRFGGVPAYFWSIFFLTLRAGYKTHPSPASVCLPPLKYLLQI